MDGLSSSYPRNRDGVVTGSGRNDGANGRKHHESQPELHQSSSRLSNNDDETRKKPKLLEENLKILLAPKEEDSGHPFFRMCNSSVMASHSVYVKEAILTTPPLNAEARGTTCPIVAVSFPDCTEETFDLMMRFLKPTEARKMTLNQAMTLAAPYDRYQFTEGKAVCDDLIDEYLQGFLKREISQRYMAMDQVVASIAISYKTNLPKALRTSEEYLLDNLACWDPLHFTVDQMKQLQPLIVHLVVCSFLDPDDVLEFESLSLADIKSEAFPYRYVYSWKELALRDQVKMPYRLRIHKVNLEGLKKVDHFDMMEEDGGWWFSIPPNLSWTTIEDVEVKLIDNVWTILLDQGPHLWENYKYGGVPLPPKDGWVSVHRCARGSPTINYIF